MTEKVSIGYICGRGNGHVELAGELDFGVCTGKAVADIYVTVENRPGLHAEDRDLLTTEEVAEYIKEVARECDMLQEQYVFYEEGNRVYVSWHDCDCEWVTKYCDKHHRKSAFVPVASLERYVREAR